MREDLITLDMNIKARLDIVTTATTLSGVGHAVAQLLEALRYKPEGRGFD